MSMLVIDPAGKVGRVMSVPRSQDAMVLGNPALGTPAFDGSGRLVYRGMPRPIMSPPGRDGSFTPPQPPDSVAVVGVNLTSRQVDTVGWTLVPKIKMDIQRDDNGRVTINAIANPLPIVDDWAVLSDGSVAIVRGLDYHVDWVNADGSITATPKLPFDWQRLSDEDKVAIIDSTRTAMEKARAAMANMSPERMMAEAMAGGGRAAGPGMVVMSFNDGASRTQTASSAGGPGGGPGMQFVPTSEMPDYRPPFTPGAARGDADGNLWIRTTAVRQGAVAAGPIYDVVNRKGELTDRIQVPAGRTIIGFGKGGIVYMLARDDKGSWVERTKR